MKVKLPELKRHDDFRCEPDAAQSKHWSKGGKESTHLRAGGNNRPVTESIIMVENVDKSDYLNFAQE